jgi:phage terminase small subunit
MAARNQHGLTPKQEAFATGVASGLTQAEAYRRAYPNSLRWKDETVWARASELMADGKVKGRVESLTQRAAAKNEVTVERVVREIARLAFSDLRDVMEWGPGGVRLLEAETLDDDAAAAIAEVSEQATGGLRIKLHNKVEALEKLAKHLDLYAPNKLQLSGGDGDAPVRIEIVPRKPGEASGSD